MTAEQRLHSDLAAFGISTTLFEHEAVFTVGESERLHREIAGAHTKNLFLKDAGGTFWLITVPADARVDLKALPAAIGCKRVSFGKAADMARLLGVTPGSVTPLAAINDAENAVKIVLDGALAAAEIVNAHPLRNTATLSLAAEDLVRALTRWHHPPQIANIPQLEPDP
jgi:Ala-tRNA(Pro) deacylase